MKTGSESDGLISQVRAWIATEDRLWITFWLIGLGFLFVWDALFLNGPAFSAVWQAVLNTLLTCLLVVVLSLLFGWGAGLLHYFLGERKPLLDLGLTFVLNIIRSVPQIVGVLVGYIILTLLIEHDLLRSHTSQLGWMALVISLFLFLEITDLIGERIDHYRKLDFFPAMLCCGITEGRIINHEILLKNSRAHILHKLVSLFGTALFLQCSIDFIVSVGLSTEVSLSNFPVTLGNMLATLDSKQDILAVGAAFLSPKEFSSLLFQHLQGISIAAMIVFTLLCMYKVSNGIVERYRL